MSIRVQDRSTSITTTNIYISLTSYQYGNVWPSKSSPTKKDAYREAPTSLAQASVLNDLGRSIGAPTARSMIS